jgi:hypothetical protein
LFHLFPVSLIFIVMFVGFSSAGVLNQWITDKLGFGKVGLSRL